MMASSGFLVPNNFPAVPGEGRSLIVAAMSSEEAVDGSLVKALGFGCAGDLESEP
jgi:hypothetical protein